MSHRGEGILIEWGFKVYMLWCHVCGKFAVCKKFGDGENGVLRCQGCNLTMGKEINDEMKDALLDAGRNSLQ